MLRCLALDVLSAHFGFLLRHRFSLEIGNESRKTTRRSLARVAYEVYFTSRQLLILNEPPGPLEKLTLASPLS